MATLLHHMQSWMQKSIVKTKNQIEKRVTQYIEQKIQAVHQCLDAFELRVLSRTTSTIDLSTLQFAVASLRSNVDVIFDTRKTDPESTPIKLAEDTVFDTLLKPLVEP